jgi:transcriptional regulator with XRE-family HTH domain
MVPAETAFNGRDSHLQAESHQIRARMIGLLLLDARRNARRSVQDCAELLGIDSSEVERWEFGDASPSLPQLELLARFLNVPVSHFWGTTTLESTERDLAGVQNEYLTLRDRMIGALIRQAREESDLSAADLANLTDINEDTLIQYEFGELPVPMHELTVIAHAVRRNLSYFLESTSQIGELLALREKWKHFSSLPEEIREFAANPLNIGFIEIAIMLSMMPTDRLRRVGESVLNITM